MDIELKTVTTNGNNEAANEQVTAGNGGGQVYRIPDATERDGLLTEKISNGETSGHAGHAAEAQMNQGITHKSSSVHRIKEELCEVIFWRFRLWMVIIFMFLLIFAVIMISLALCSAIYEDADEKFDKALFNVTRGFNGSFTLPNQVFTEELLTLSFNKSQVLAADLQKKLAALYGSSPALERYFSEAKIYAFRNGSVIAEYQLTFLMPAEYQDQLEKFTLSREMVYNVFRQFLYDQETDKSDPMYIDPFSLNMV